MIARCGTKEKAGRHVQYYTILLYPHTVTVGPAVRGSPKENGLSPFWLHWPINVAPSISQLSTNLAKGI
jgi:hypothetical protein